MKLCLGQKWLKYFCCALSLRVKFIRNRLKDEILPGAKVTKIFLLRTFLASKISLKQEITVIVSFLYTFFSWFDSTVKQALLWLAQTVITPWKLTWTGWSGRWAPSSPQWLPCFVGLASRSFQAPVTASLLPLCWNTHSQWRWDIVSNIQKLQCSVAVIMCKQIWNKNDC